MNKKYFITSIITFALFALSSCGSNAKTTDSDDDSDRQSAKIENADLPDGVYAEYILGDGRTYSLKENGAVLCDGEILTGANWSFEDKAIVIYTGEGTSFFTILDGYLYGGYYKNGQCWVEEWVGDGEDGGLEDVGYIPTPDKGEKIKKIRISNKTSQGTNTITNTAESSADNGIQNNNGVIGHTYENARIGIQWTFVNDHYGLARFDYDDGGKEFTWGYGENGNILIYGKYKDVDAGVEIIDNGNRLNVLDFSNGSEFVMLRIK